MTTAAGVLLFGLLAVVSIAFMGWFVAFPIRTIFALYAASLPWPVPYGFRFPFLLRYNTLSTLFGSCDRCGSASCRAQTRWANPTLPIAMWFLFLAWATLTVFWAGDTESRSANPPGGAPAPGVAGAGLNSSGGRRGS
jgi:hypothetical protein